MIAPLILALTIFSAYPDPLLAENGGEAVQLHNPAATPSSTEGLVIATKTASYALPTTTVLPGGGFLITDTGWSGSAGLRDNHSWPDADHEIGMSLANTDGFVELRRNLGNGSSELIDRLVWNNTVGRAREGYAWTHNGEAKPFFFNSSMQLVPFTILIEEIAAPPRITNITLPDDAPQPGTQLLGYARNVTIQAIVTNAEVVTARFGGREIELERVESTNTYRGTISIPALPSGTEEITITARGEGGESEERVIVTILATAAISVTELVLRGTSGSESSGGLIITNHGNSRRSIRLVTLPAGVRCEPPHTVLEPGMNATIACSGTPNRAWSENTGYALISELKEYVE